jgi:hypothetical protein
LEGERFVERVGEGDGFTTLFSHKYFHFLDFDFILCKSISTEVVGPFGVTITLEIYLSLFDL